MSSDDDDASLYGLFGGGGVVCCCCCLAAFAILIAVKRKNGKLRGYVVGQVPASSPRPSAYSSSGGDEDVLADIDVTTETELERILKLNGLFSLAFYETLRTNNIDVETLRKDVRYEEVDQLCVALGLGIREKLNLRSLWRALNGDEAPTQSQDNGETPGNDGGGNEESFVIEDDDQEGLDVPGSTTQQ